MKRAVLAVYNFYVEGFKKYDLGQATLVVDPAQGRVAVSGIESLLL